MSHLRSHPRTRPLLRQQVAAPRAPTGHQARCLGVLQEKAQPRARVRGLQGEVGRTWGAVRLSPEKIRAEIQGGVSKNTGDFLQNLGDVQSILKLQGSMVQNGFSNG